MIAFETVVKLMGYLTIAAISGAFGWFIASWIYDKITLIIQEFEMRDLKVRDLDTFGVVERKTLFSDHARVLVNIDYEVEAMRRRKIKYVLPGQPIYVIGEYDLSHIYPNNIHLYKVRNVYGEKGYTISTGVNIEDIISFKNDPIPCTHIQKISKEEKK